jgi:uncharacterized protein YjiS (DUF1127 family)
MSNRLLLSGSSRLRLPHFDHPNGPFWTTVRSAWRRYRSRQRIAQLDPHLLKDIGVTYAEAEAEANKPFWYP